MKGDAICRGFARYWFAALDFELWLAGSSEGSCVAMNPLVAKKALRVHVAGTRRARRNRE